MSDENEDEQKDESTEDSEQQSEQQPVEGNQPAEESDKQPAQETDQAAEQSEEQPSDSDQSTEQAEDQPADTDQATGQAEEQSSDSGQAADQSEAQPTESDQPAEQSDETPASEREQSTEQTEEQPTESEQPAEQSIGTERPSTTVIAIVDGDDVYLDPPVRLWPQYDERWNRQRIGGLKTGKLIDWNDNGCNASTAAMTLRWFAEDCTAGRIAFPTKPGGSIDPSWYGLRMGESFWPNADPPGKVELTLEGRIYFRKLYSVAAHYLKTGEIQRKENGDVVDPSGPNASYVTAQPPGGWLSLIRSMLKTGPVIVGIGAPAGHFVLAHGIIAGALLVADPGGVLYRAHNGGTTEIANWKGKEGYLDGTTDKEKVRMPSPSQWPGGNAPGQEGDGRSYNHISGQYLSDMLDKLISVTSLTYPEGAKLGGHTGA